MNRKTIMLVSLCVLFPVVSLGIVEVIARIWEYDLAQGPMGWELVGTRRLMIEVADNQKFYTLRPKTSHLFEGVSVEINSQGLRDIERDFEK
jgi:hypothetical protein